MTNQPSMLNPSIDCRLLCNLRRSRLEIEEIGLQLDEAIARFDENRLSAEAEAHPERFEDYG